MPFRYCGLATLRPHRYSYRNPGPRPQHGFIPHNYFPPALVLVSNCLPSRPARPPGRSHYGCGDVHRLAKLPRGAAVAVLYVLSCGCGSASTSKRSKVVGHLVLLVYGRLVPHHSPLRGPAIIRCYHHRVEIPFFIPYPTEPCVTLLLPVLPIVAPIPTPQEPRLDCAHSLPPAPPGSAPL
jgi:hypothetical protein